MTLPRVLATDLDGTLLRSDMTIDINFLEPIIRQLQDEKFVNVVLISGILYIFPQNFSFYSILRPFLFVSCINSSEHRSESTWHSVMLYCG